MHFQEVFRAIYDNHMYEYIIINKSFKVVEFSEQTANYCDKSLLKSKEPDIFELFPELYGMERELQELLEEGNPPIFLPNIFKEPNYYINIHIHKGREHETLVILLENVTQIAIMEQSLIQDRNEKALLLDELEEKNAQLKLYNEQMHKLVEIESQKNIEKQKMLELSSRHAQMGEIIGMITHQWKQPLGVISMLCSALEVAKMKENLTDEMFYKSLDGIKKQVKHMDATVMAFQNFFKPAKSKQRFNIKKTIETIIDLVYSDYAMNNISIELHGDETVDAFGYANEYNQVVLSILKNAKDVFMQKPHDDMKIVIDIGKKEGRSFVRIRDNAGGIDEAIIDKIFDLYMSTKKEGSGLGLNIAKNVIEKNMNGKLEVHNVDNGAEFMITL